VSSVKTSHSSAQRLHADRQLLLDVDSVSVTFGGEKALDDVSFCIHSGEFIGLIGPNGAGKTTLLKVVLGLMKPTRGSVTAHEGRIGYIPQRGFMQNTQLPLSVLEVVALGAKGNTQKAQQALGDGDMMEFAKKRFTELSGGQQQRVLIAKALAAEPAVLILDEPTTGIDEQSQARFYAILRKLHQQSMTILIISHDIDTVLKQADRVICLNRTILYDGAPEHFDADQYMPSFYANQHRLLHHQHGGGHA
jgi:zinc transport system ATP-binding protein